MKRRFNNIPTLQINGQFMNSRDKHYYKYVKSPTKNKTLKLPPIKHILNTNYQKNTFRKKLLLV